MLGLPEVVEMEIVKVLSAAGRDEVQSLEESFRRLRIDHRIAPRGDTPQRPGVVASSSSTLG